LMRRTPVVPLCESRSSLLLRQHKLAQLSALEPALHFLTDKLPSGEGSEGTNGDSAGKRARTSPAGRA